MGFKLVILPPDGLGDSSVVDNWPGRLREAIPGIEVTLCRSPGEAMESIQDADAAFGNIVPELFERAVAIEQKVLTEAGVNGEANFGDRAMRGRQYTWSGGETLVELQSRRDQILERHEATLARAKRTRANVPLVEALAEAFDEDDDTAPCTVCAL